MRFLVVLSPKPEVRLPQIQPHLAAEEQIAWRMYRDGHVRDFFMTDRLGTVVVIAEAVSTEQVHQRMTELPLIKADLLQLEVLELRAFTNWESLFQSSVLTALGKQE